MAGTRIAVERVVELLAEDWSTEDILDQYSALSREDIQACSALRARATPVWARLSANHGIDVVMRLLVDQNVQKHRRGNIPSSRSLPEKRDGPLLYT